MLDPLSHPCKPAPHSHLCIISGATDIVPAAADVGHGAPPTNHPTK